MLDKPVITGSLILYNLRKAAASGINASANYSFARSQAQYMMGQNPQNQCFVVGFDGNCPEKPHHRSSSCPASGDCNNGQSNGGPNPMVSSEIILSTKFCHQNFLFVHFE